MHLVEPRNMLDTCRCNGLNALSPFFITQLLPDETLYSLVARFHMLNGRPRVSATLSLLFGTSLYLSLHTLLPNRIGYFNNKLTADADNNGINAIEHFTCLPYFRNFLRESLYDTACQAFLTQNNNTSIRRRLGLHSFHSSSPTLRYCSDCKDQDLLMYGVPYWRRLHQLPMVHVCYVHNRPLTDIPIRFYNQASESYSLDLPPAARSSISNAYPNYVGARYPIYKRFVEDMYTTLRSRIMRQVDPRIIYIERCRELGYIWRRYVAKKRLARDIADYYGRIILDEAGYNEDWLSRSLLKHMDPGSRREINNPAAHLIMIGFLFKSFNNFISYTTPQSTHHNWSTVQSVVHSKSRTLLTTRESVVRAVGLVKRGLSVTAASRIIKCSPEPVRLLASIIGLILKPRWVRLCIGNTNLRIAVATAEPLTTVAKRFDLCLEYINAMLIVDVGLKEKRNASIKAAKQR